MNPNPGVETRKETMDNELVMGYGEALALTLETVSPLGGSERVDLADAVNRILAEDLLSRVDSPSIDASTKDGYAVISGDVESAAPGREVRLTVIGTAAAGRPADRPLTPGTAMRILTGARIPEGADAVLSGEYAAREGDSITVFNNAGPGRNILPRGVDVAAGEPVAVRGERLTPGLIGNLVAAGHGSARVYRTPRVAILATGDELVTPGLPLPEGKLYASNLAMIRAWCSRFGFPATVSVLGDSPGAIQTAIRELVSGNDTLLTSGGAWTGDRDFIADALDLLGWKRHFHRIRMGPGKAAGFGTLEGRPVFLLPGGPPSNLTAFLQIALPGLLKLGGDGRPGLPRVTVRLADDLRGRETDWTHFIYGQLTDRDGHTLFQPLRLDSRLRSLARADAVVAIPEGTEFLAAGTMTTAQLLL
jgi:molybdopterin molybdotransferase